MIDPTHKISIVRQAKALGIARSTVYYKPVPTADSDLGLMAAMDRLHLDYPFAGARMLPGLLRAQGLAAGRARVTRLMRKMGIEAVYRKSNTSRRNFAHKVYPYLLRNLTIERANQVWAMDITYLPMKRGFL